MNININNDLESRKMIFSVSLPKRRSINEKKVFFTWNDVEKHVKENYTPPKGYSLGECLNRVVKADNDNRCNQSWEFVLTSTSTATAPKAKVVKKVVQKKTRDN